MTSCGDIDLLRDPGPVWEPGFSPIGSNVIKFVKNSTPVIEFEPY